jgi:hypothetical protein
MAPEDQMLQPLLTHATLWSVLIIQSGIGRSFLPVLQPYANMTGFLSMTQWVKATGTLNENEGAEYIGPNTTFEAVRCVFYLSVKETLVNVKNGLYSEEVLQEYTLTENIPTTPTYTLNGTNYYFNDPEGNCSLVYQPPFAKTTPNLNDTFIIPFNSYEMLASQLSAADFLNGNVSTRTSAGLSGPNIPSMLYQADNVTRAMYTMVQYMSNSMRANDSNILQEKQQNSSLIAPEQAIAGGIWVQKQSVTVR